MSVADAGPAARGNHAPQRTHGVPQCLAAAHDGVLFAGLLSGGVQVLPVFASGTGSATALLPLPGGARALAVPEGSATGVVAASSSGSVSALDVASGAAVATFDAAASRAPTALCGFADLRTGFVGDEAGGVLRVDLRAARPRAHAFEHGDYISALSELPDARTLLAASGDGALGVYDARKTDSLPLAAIAAAFDDDLCDLAVDAARAVAGTLEGALHVYDTRQLARLARGAADEAVDVRRFRGHPDSVSAVALVADVAVTGCADGLVRVVDPGSGGLLALLEFDRSWAHVAAGDGADGDDEGDAAATNRGAKKRRRETRWPIEAMAVVEGVDGKEVLALAGHEKCVRFVDLSVLRDSDGEQDAEGAGAEGGEAVREPAPPPSPPRRKVRGKKKRGHTFSRARRDDGFFGDL